jgi:hypothetical protein
MSFNVASALAAPLFLLYLVFIGLVVYALILFIQLARRGIKALDIYLEENNRRGPADRQGPFDRQ